MKMWGNRAGDLDFSFGEHTAVGDYIAVSDVVVDHFRSQVSVNSTDDTETEVCHCDSFLCTMTMNSIKIIEIKKSIICVMCYPY